MTITVVLSMYRVSSSGYSSMQSLRSQGGEAGTSGSSSPATNMDTEASVMSRINDAVNRNKNLRESFKGSFSSNDF